jgi:hypothetical protein
METLRGFPNLPAMGLSWAKPAFVHAIAALEAATYVPSRHYCPPARRAYFFKFFFRSPATGPITLEKAWPHRPGKSVAAWPHEPGDLQCLWHLWPAPMANSIAELGPCMACRAYAATELGARVRHRCPMASCVVSDSSEPVSTPIAKKGGFTWIRPSLLIQSPLWPSCSYRTTIAAC